MKKLYLPIFWKLNITIILTVSIFGIFNIYFVWNNVFNKFEIEVVNRIINIGYNISNQSTHSILYNDLSALQMIVNNSLTSDSIIAYCFIVNDKNEVLAHTFEDKLPSGLKYLHSKNKTKDSVSIINVKAQNFLFENLKDIRIPIIDGSIGFVRIGIKSNVVELFLKQSILYFVIVFIVFTIMGFIGSYGFSKFLTDPIKNLRNVAEKIDLKNISYSKLVLESYLKNNESRFYVVDEMDDLTKSFNNMIQRLEQTYIKLITTQTAMNQSEKLASIGTLVSGLAHEINNPLSGLQSCLRRISDHPENINQNIKYIEIMNEATCKIQNVVVGLLNFSRVSDSKKTQFSINQIINNAINLIKYRTTHKDIMLVFEDNNSNYEVLCDKNELEQVFFNLLKNAYEAIEDKFKIVEDFIPVIEIIMNLEDNNVSIEIIDNGKGIPKENISRIFDPFFTTKDIGKGTGLGCSICYNIIKDHNGTISVESIELEKTTFRILLPKCDE